MKPKAIDEFCCSSGSVFSSPNPSGQLARIITSHAENRKGIPTRVQARRAFASLSLEAIVALGENHGFNPPGNQNQRQLGETSLQALYRYLCVNHDAIVDYQKFKKAGYYISSAVVEKTIDLLVCRRLKLRGQNWSRDGADNVVAFREMMLLDLWQSYWQRQKVA